MTILDKVISLFKKYIKNEELTKNVNEEINEEIPKEITEEINDNVPELHICSEEEPDFLNLKFGTIIWAKRYNNKKKKNNIPKGHREGPFIVLNKVADKLLCLYCSSNPSNDEYSYRIMKLENDYNLNKETYVYVSKPYYIEEKMFIQEMDYLSLKDRIKLLKKIDIVKNENLYVDIDINIEKLLFDKGDIFKYQNKIYLIIDKDDTLYKCLEINTKSGDLKILINGIYYYVMLNRIISINKSSNIMRYDLLSEECLKIINTIVTRNLNDNNRNESKVIDRGSVVFRNDLLYYVKGELSDNWLAFEIFSEKKEDYRLIKINNRTYYTDFENEIMFSKKDESYTFLERASQDEINNIKLIKLDYKKKESRKNVKHEKLIRPGIKSGVLVESRLPNDSMYAIINRKDNDIICVNIKNQKLRLKKLNEVKFVRKLTNDEFKMILESIKDRCEKFIDKEYVNRLIKKMDSKK